jgi:hypothetical protein
MIPFGPRMNTVFASRSKALLWAGGILLTAYCSVPSVEQTRQEDAARAAPAAQPTRSNPWALDGK